MKKQSLSAMWLLVALALGGANRAAAATLFAENFETYAVSTNLLGQGGWFGGGDPVIVRDSGPLPTKVLDGINSVTGSFFGFARHSILGGRSVAGASTMSFDGFASSSGSHDSWAGCSNANDGSSVLSLSNAVLWEFDRSAGGWAFRVRQSTAQFHSFSVGGGSDTAGQFSIFVDPVALQAWGTYDFGAGTIETTRFPVAADTLAALDAVNIGFDFRGTRGIQVDNIVVSSVPSPAAFWLLGPALGCLGMLRRRSA